MEENTQKFEIKIDPLDFHVGLKDQMAEFKSLIRINNPGKKLAENVEKKLKSSHLWTFSIIAEREMMRDLKVVKWRPIY